MSKEFDDLFKALEKSMTKGKEKNAQMFAASDLKMLSFVPHGIPTRQPMFDLTIGKDGVPIGKVIEFFGFERSGKTTAAYHLIGECQRMGGAAMFIDTEMSFDAIRARECGCAVDGSTLKIVSASTIDSIFRTIDRFLDTLKDNGFTRDVLIVVDSVTAVEAEFSNDNDWKAQGRPGEDARVLRSGLRRIMPKLADQKVTLLFINHAISNMNAYGKKSQSAGGHAIKFFASLRVEFKSTGELRSDKDDDNDDEDRERLGQKVQVTVEKLKGGHLKSQTYNTRLLNAGGFDSVSQLLEACLEVGVIKKMNNVSYALINKQTGEEEDAFQRAEWPEWINLHGGFDECYSWWRKHAIAAGKIVPWGTTEED